MGENGAMPEPEPKLKIYGLSLSRRRYVIIQVVAFLWMLVLYGYWRHAGLQKSPHAFVRHFDLLLLAAYLYGVAETLIVLKRFKKAAGKTKADSPGGK